MTATNVVEPVLGRFRPYVAAAQARELRAAGKTGPAAETEILLFWDGRCTRCGHPLSKEASQAAGLGRDCARHLSKQ